MYNTEIIKILTLRVEIALSLRQHSNIIGLYWIAQYDSLQPHICIMNAVINDNIINEFIWNQIKIFMSPLPISSMHGFWGGGVDCGFKGLEALECEL